MKSLLKKKWILYHATYATFPIFLFRFTCLFKLLSQQPALYWVWPTFSFRHNMTTPLFILSYTMPWDSVAPTHMQPGSAGELIVE